MLKMKTVKSVVKRLKKNSSGKFKHKQANLRHLLTKKSTKRKRHLRSHTAVFKGDLKNLINCLPYA